MMEEGEDHAMQVGQATQDPFSRMQTFMEAQFRNTNENIAKMNSTITKVNEKVGVNSRNLTRLKTTMEKNADNTDIEIHRLHKIVENNEEKRSEEMKQIRQSIEEIRTAQSQPQHGGNPRTGDLRVDGRASDLDIDYWRARRSIRIWPVRQDHSGALLSPAMIFIHDLLRVPRSEITVNDVEDVRRPTTKRRRNRESSNTEYARNEIVVRFKTTEIRDSVMSHSPNLAEHISNDGKPTAGVRLEVPSHLTSAMQDFLNYGRDLHKQHGSGFKRYIKFDDTEMCLFMQARLPNTDEWLHIDHAMAIESRRVRAKRNVAFSRSRLSSSQGSSAVEDDCVEVTHEAEKQTAETLQTSSTLQKFARTARHRDSTWE